MKPLLFTLFSLFVIVSATNAQLLYGTTSEGGIYGGGTITMYNGATQHINSVKSFSVDGTLPRGSLMRAVDGKLYGMTAGGGYHSGTIFSYDAATDEYNQLVVFNGTNGNLPGGSLVQATDGKLYGMTAEGGTNNLGVIFSFDPATSIFERLYNFSGPDGNRPVSGLTLAANGLLYGMTDFGGTYNKGVIFSFNPQNSAFTKLHNFDGTNGGNPFGSLMQASDGKLYGTAGVIFSFDIATSTYTKLYSDFATKCDLIQATDGKLYGTLAAGGDKDFGAIFSFDIATNTFSELYDFDGPNGAYPEERLLQASDGNLYGMASTVHNVFDVDTSVIFSFNPVTLTYTKVHQFTLKEGGYSTGHLIQNEDGKLYAMTQGNLYYNGTIFSFNISNDNYTTLRVFGVNKQGYKPSGSLCKATDGNLYGMTQHGGSYNSGVFYSYNPATAVFKQLFEFDGSNGGGPLGSLLQASNGKLYGMTSGGGNKGYGVIFSYNTATSTYTKLYDFEGGLNGGIPFGTLIQATDGKLYGITYNGGGSGNNGVIFSFDPATSTYTKLYSLEYKDGSTSTGSLIQATNGKLYGMTTRGGANRVGTLFSFDPSTATFSRLLSFNGTTGASPHGSLVQAKDGKLYGMTYDGGSSGSRGVIFSYNPKTDTYTKLQDFTGTNGANPYGSLLQASNGKLYGMTYAGGIYNYGVAFSYDPAAQTGNYQKVADFKDTSGRGPYYTSFIELSCTPTTSYKDADGDGFGDVNSPSATQSCMPEDGYVMDSTDCNDNDSTIYPGAPELCDGKDNNCDGVTDDNCSMITVNIGNAIAFEGNSGTKPINFKVTLSSTSTSTVKVDYKTVNSTAKATEDYKAAKGTLTFAPGVKEQIVTVLIKGDTKVEFPELFRVQLSNAVNATVGNGSGTGLIFNDDFHIGANESEITAQSTQQNTISNQQRSVVAYPNPAKNVVSVRLSGYSSIVSLQLTSLQGKVLKTTNLQVKGNVSQQLNVADLASGTYFLIAKDATGHQQTVKLVVTH